MKIIVVKRDGKNYISSGCYGTFYVLNKSKGVKVLDCGFTSIRKLKASTYWSDAEKEVKFYNDAYVSGVVPKCYGVRPIRVKDGHTSKYYAGIVLSYIKGREIYDDEVSSKEYRGVNVSVYLTKKIRDASGIIHDDLYGHNILVRLNKYGEIIKAWAIDFSPTCCDRV